MTQPNEPPFPPLSSAINPATLRLRRGIADG